MALAFKGRWESRFTVPSGGASVSATVANGASAQTITVPAGSFYLTEAGGVPGLVATLQTQLNTKHELMGFPRAAAVMDAVVGGDWTNGSGWLCQEASGNLAPVFGAVTLTASGTPTYQNDGIKDGDYAVGFDASTEYFDGGDVNDAGATDDLLIVWVGKWTGDPATNGTIISKVSASFTEGWALASSATNNFWFRAKTTGGTLWSSQVSDRLVGEWHVGIAAVDRAAGTLRMGIRGLTTATNQLGTPNTVSADDFTSGSAFRFGASPWTATSQQNFQMAAFYAVSGSGVAAGIPAGLATALESFANAINAAWSVSLDTSGGTGRVSIGWSGYETPTHSLTWTSTDLRDVLGFDEHISNATSTTTGAKQAKGLWLPDSPMNCDDHPSMAPEETDLRTTESPTGAVFGLVGNKKLAHHNVRYRRVPVDRIREASATYANQSLEVFFRDTQIGQGHPWFSPASPVQVWWSNAGTDALLGADKSVAGWKAVGFSRFGDICKLSQEGFHGQFDVRFPRLVSDG